MYKKAITIIACEDTYRNLSTFEDIAELNKTVRYYKEKFSNELTRLTLAVLDQLHRYSAKYFGCSFRSKANIAESLNISRRTVIRACQLLEDLGIIKQYNMKRKSDMLQTSNCIVIQPFVTQEKPETAEKCHTKTTTISKTNTKKEIRTDKPVRNNPPKFVASWVNHEFSKLASYFMQPKEVEELWRISMINGKIYNLCSGDIVEVAIDSFKALVTRMKSIRIQNPMGYFNNTIKRNMHRKYTFDLLSSLYGSA